MRKRAGRSIGGTSERLAATIFISSNCTRSRFPVGIALQPLADFALEAFEHGRLVRVCQNPVGDGLRAFAPPTRAMLEIVLGGLSNNVRAETTGKSLGHGGDQRR